MRRLSGSARLRGFSHLVRRRREARGFLAAAGAATAGAGVTTGAGATTTGVGASVGTTMGARSTTAAGLGAGLREGLQGAVGAGSAVGAGARFGCCPRANGERRAHRSGVGAGAAGADLSERFQTPAVALAHLEGTGLAGGASGVGGALVEGIGTTLFESAGDAGVRLWVSDGTGDGAGVDFGALGGLIGTETLAGFEALMGTAGLDATTGTVGLDATTGTVGLDATTGAGEAMRTGARGAAGGGRLSSCLRACFVQRLLSAPTDEANGDSEIGTGLKTAFGAAAGSAETAETLGGALSDCSPLDERVERAFFSSK